MEVRKQILDKFEKHVADNFIQYCSLHQLQPDVNSLIAYLVDFEIISHKSVQDYTIQREFDSLYPLEQFKKTKTVLRLANRFNISERTVWNILKNSTNERTPRK